MRAIRRVVPGLDDHAVFIDTFSVDFIERCTRESGYDGRVSVAQIQYFVAVAEEGHVGRAARRLRIAQPPVSRQIRALEDEIGTPLFARTPRGMQLLPAGEAFLEHARGILSAMEAARIAARARGAAAGSGAR